MKRRATSRRQQRRGASRLRLFHPGWTALLMVLLVGALVHAQANLVKNHDFSQGTNERGAPLYWNIAQDSRNMQIDLSTERALVGEYSVRFEDRDNDGALALRSDPIPITGGAKYLAEVQVFVVEGKGTVYVEFRDANQDRIASSRTSSTRIGEWEKLSVEAVAPDAAQYVTMLLYSDKPNTGVHFFDDVSLVEVPSIFTSAAAAPAPAASQSAQPAAGTSSSVAVGTRVSGLVLAGPSEVTMDLTPSADQLDYTPADGDVVLSNPPSFIWIPVLGARTYILEYSTDPTFPVDKTHVVTDIDLSVYTPDHTLTVNEPWYWRVRPVDGRGNMGPPTSTRSFIVHPDAFELPLPPMDEVKARIPKEHPRLFVTPQTLPLFKEKRTSDLLFREILWKNIQTRAQTLFYAPLTPEPPHAMPGGVRDINLWREYRLAVEATNNAETLAFYYMLTGDPQAAQNVRKWVMHIMSWDPKGATSAAVNDEASMPILHKIARVYTWAHDVFTPEERKKIHEVMLIRATEAYNILRSRTYESRPYASHSARQLGFLLEPAIAFLGEIPEAEEWLDYVVRTIFAVYPAWGGDDGGWSEGQAYFSSYVNRGLWFVDILREATGLDLFERAFFRNNGWFKLYTHPPYANIGPFGDHADRGPTQQDGNIMRVYAARYQNPYFQWYAEQMGGGIETGVMGYIRAVLHPPFQVRGTAPTDLPPSRYFADIGWVAIHRRLGDTRDDIQFMFRSSPYGTWSHSLADQNSFTIEAYGEPLAISSGYRPWYGSDHHMGWTKATQAHNAILVNGQGQLVQSIVAKGQITGFLNGRSFDYTAGDATPAYGTLLNQAVRRVVYLRPDVFVVFDDLVAPRASEYSWLLHAYYQFEYNEEAGTIAIPGKKASLETQLWSSLPTRYEQTNEFAVPLDEPMDVAEQWHFKATTTERAPEAYFLAVMRPRKNGDQTAFLTDKIAVTGGQGTRVQVDGLEAYILFRTEEGAVLKSDALTSNGVTAAWSKQERIEGLLLVEGTEWKSASGLQLRSNAPIDIELTIEQTDEGFVIDGALDGQHAEHGVVFDLQLTVPGLTNVSSVEADVDVEWELKDGVLSLKLQPNPRMNKITIRG